MPKKFKGENSKAVEARARKDAQKQAEKDQKEREKEDALWQDDDKHIARKQQRKDEKEKKRLEQQEKKQQLKQLYDDEMSQIKSKTLTQTRLTRAEIEANRQAAAAAGTASKPTPSHDELPLEENVNRLVTEGDEARSVEEAISLLSTRDPELEKHPEKRVKAAYQKFEEENLPRLKQENPNMRLSQLKQLLKKDWMKSPENPLNQRHIAYNAK
ncbi:coiled-coil domain-containing protein 124-like isoform X2 [Liolophura sinensis]|uniref:coiled-coil domain-containing protein 124-like isoform X2 n=1 Tax=Liolophura sinensis TaxID=3198878 RepID=UPI0031590662